MQYVTQDLALVGNPILVAADGTQVNPSPFLGCPQAFDTSLPAEERERLRCLELEDVSASSSVLRMRYVSSQFAAADACRDVAYRLNAGTIERSDVPCVLDVWGDPQWEPLAPSALAFKVFVVCSDGDVFEDVPDGACSPPGGYSRSAVLSVAAESATPVPTGAGASWTLVGFNAAAARVDSQQACDADRLCFSAAAEVLMPNLKE
jgi:hypothetical protein